MTLLSVRLIHQTMVMAPTVILNRKEASFMESDLSEQKSDSLALPSKITRTNMVAYSHGKAELCTSTSEHKTVTPEFYATQSTSLFFFLAGEIDESI